MYLIEDILSLRASDVVWPDVPHEQVVVSAASDENFASLGECLGQGLAVSDHLPGVVSECFRGNFLKLDTDGCNVSVVWAALQLGEDCEVDSFFVFLAVEDEGGSGATEGFVSSGGHDIRVLEGGGQETTGNETASMCDVGEQKGADFVANRAETCVVEVTRVT